MRTETQMEISHEGPGRCEGSLVGGLTCQGQPQTPWATPFTALLSQVLRAGLTDSLCGAHFTEVLGEWDSASSGNNQLSVHDSSCVACQEVRAQSLPSRSS